MIADTQELETTTTTTTSADAAGDYDDAATDDGSSIPPSRVHAKALRGFVFWLFGRVWSVFENHGWKLVGLFVCWRVFSRQIAAARRWVFRNRLRSPQSVQAALRGAENIEKMREDVALAREKQTEALEKASKEEREKKTDRRVEEVEAKANRLGVPLRRKGYVLGRE